MARYGTRRRLKRDPNATVFVFKVALQAQKKIWRRIALRSDQTLDDFHECIFVAFDRYDEHLYSFYLPPPGSKGRRAMMDALEYTSPIMLEQPGPFDWMEAHDASKTAVGSLGLEAKRQLRYLFDFGDDWWHEITVEQIDGTPDDGEYPRVVERRGDSPPQYPDLEEDWE